MTLNYNKQKFWKVSHVMSILFFFTTIVTAQNRPTVYLWPNNVPGETEDKQEPSQAEGESDVIRLTKVTNPALIVFEPKKNNNLGKGIIVCPGGGYNLLAIDKEGYEVAEWLNTLGYTAFVLQYRVPNREKGALMDLQRAIRVVRDQSETYRIDNNDIGVIGFSAGGSLCARASTSFTDQYPKMDYRDSLSGRPDYSMLIYPAYLDQGENKAITPELIISDKTPPFFIFGTSDDVYGNSSLVMTTELRNHKVPVELHLLEKGGHGYGLRSGNSAAETWPTLAEKWLKSAHPPRDNRTQNFPKSTIFIDSILKKEDVWVFMMAGQSNMAGRGHVEPMDTITSKRILTINKDNRVILAKEPLHFYEPSMSGLDCGISFGKELLKKTPEHVSILLIPTAVGGSTVSQWIGDSIHRNVPLLSNFEEKVRLGQKIGTLKGILWLQGESDANNEDIPKYHEKLSQLIGKFRVITGEKNLPILIGALGSYSTDKENWEKINHILKDYVLSDVNTRLIPTSDLKDRGDQLHFNAEAQRILGKRFAKAYVEMKK